MRKTKGRAVLAALWAVPLIAFTGIASAVPSGQQPPSESAPPSSTPQTPVQPAHKVRVWTNEDLIATRTPADVYVFAKEAEAAARDQENLRNITSCFAFGPPEPGVEETQKMIAETNQSIRDGELAVAQSRRELQDAPQNLRARDQVELARREAELENSRERLRALQDHLRQLTGELSVPNSQ